MLRDREGRWVGTKTFHPLETFEMPRLGQTVVEIHRGCHGEIASQRHRDTETYRQLLKCTDTDVLRGAELEAKRQMSWRGSDSFQDRPCGTQA